MTNGHNRAVGNRGNRGGLFTVLYTGLANQRTTWSTRLLRALDGFEWWTPARPRVVEPLRERALCPHSPVLSLARRSLRRLHRRFRRRFYSPATPILDRRSLPRHPRGDGRRDPGLVLVLHDPKPARAKGHPAPDHVRLGDDVFVPRPRRDRESPRDRASVPDPHRSSRCARSTRVSVEPPRVSNKHSTTIVAVPGPLSDEFMRMLGETRAGSGRAEAMRAMEQRIDIPEIKSSCSRSSRPTRSVSRSAVCLRAQAEELASGVARRRRRWREGAGQDVDPDGVLHLPRAVRRGARPRAITSRRTLDAVRPPTRPPRPRRGPRHHRARRARCVPGERHSHSSLRLAEGSLASACGAVFAFSAS